MRFIQWTTHARISIFLIICCSQSLAAESDLTRAELQSLLKERDAAIIELQHTIRDMMTRLETVERSMSPVPASITASTTASPPAAGDDPAPPAPAHGFARLEVDEQAAQRALERTLTQGGTLLLPAWRIQFGPSIGYSLNQTDFPVLVEEGDTLLLGSNDVERTAFNANLAVQVGLPFASQLELGLPYQWVDEEIRPRILGAPIGQTIGRNGKGIGSLKIGLAKTFVRERGWRPDLVGRISWDTGSGDRTDNGVSIAGFESLGGSLSFIKRTDPLVFFGSASYRTFFEDDDMEPGDQFAVSFGTALAVSPSSSLFASISNQFLAEREIGNERIDGSDVSSFALNVGASTVVSRGILLSLATGIGISENAPDYSVRLSATLQTDALRTFLDR
jgi:hypothetical protein